MARRLRAWTVLPEGLALIPRTHVVIYHSSSRSSYAFFWRPWAPGIIWGTCRCADKRRMHIELKCLIFSKKQFYSRAWLFIAANAASGHRQEDHFEFASHCGYKAGLRAALATQGALVSKQGRKTSKSINNQSKFSGTSCSL